MKTFLFIFLAGYAVRCDDSNYYVVQMPDNDFLPAKDFRVYWNVPTMQCRSKKIFFGDLYEKYGILQNAGDTFRGDKISILYDPGEFPALLRNSSSGEIKYRNGGVPQEGDLIRHLDTFQKVLEQSVPDKNFDGVGIIDFESWKPVLRQNFGILTPYKDVSYEIEKKRHWWWKKQWIQEEAKRRFEEAGREFMQATVSLAKKMRPSAVWGYYGFPYCYSMAYNNRKESCADKVPQENDRISWLWQESTALYPSVYSSDDITSNQLAGLIRGRVKEAARVAARGAPILPYFWYRYRDKGYFNKSDLDVALSTFYKSNASGFIIWGSSNDVNTIEKCKNLKQYVTNTLGPAIAKYTKRNMRLGDDPDETYNVVFNPNNASKYDPEYTWIPPVNYTQKIEELVDKELKEEKEAAAAHKNINESILVDMILDKIANYCAEGCDDKRKVKLSDGKEGDGVINDSLVVLVTKDPFKKNSNRTEVNVPTTTEEDIYDYYTDTTEDIYETNEYIVVSTTSKSIEKISTTNAKEQHSTADVSNEESSITAIRTSEVDEKKLIIEDINAVDLSKEETYSAEEITTEISIALKPTTTEDIYDYYTDTTEDNIAEDIYKTNEYIVVSTTSKSVEQISTTTAKPIDISIVDISKEESDIFNINKEKHSTVDVSNEESSLSAIRTTKVDEKKLIIEDISAVDLSKEETYSTEESTTEISSTTLSSTELSINDLSINSFSPEGTSITKNDLRTEKKSTESSSIEVDLIDISTEESSTTNPTTIDSTTVGTHSVRFEPSTIDDDTKFSINSATVEPRAVDNGTTVGTKSDNSTTLAPVFTEQVLGSVSRAIVSKPVTCSLFYIYSITKCLCVLFGNC